MDNIFTTYGQQVRMHPVEIFITDQSGRYFLPDDVILREEQIVALSILPPALDEDTAPPTYVSQLSPATARPLIGIEAFWNAYLTLKEGSDIIMEDVPFATFGLFEADKIVPQIFTTDITPSKSYVTVADPTNTVTAGESIILNFYYLQKSNVR